jgi:hypothetical protein
MHMPRGIQTERGFLTSLVNAHSHRTLRFPGILVGDGRLGGISATISAYETLLLRGYDTDAVVLMDSGLGNGEAIEGYLQGKAPVVVLPQLPSVEEVSVLRSVFAFFILFLFGEYWEIISVCSLKQAVNSLSVYFSIGLFQANLRDKEHSS